MEPHGTRTAPYLLTSDLAALKVNPNPPRALHGATVAVELRALWLWQLGAGKAGCAAEAMTRALTTCAPGVPPSPLEVTRLDLTADFQGWEPASSDLSQFTTRAVHRQTFHTRRDFTGFMFGRGEIAARLYDKTREIRDKSGKTWFRDIWAASPAFDPGAPVWRLEFQLRRDGLRTFRLPSGASIESWEDARGAVRALWSQLCTRWLALRAPRTARQRHRLRPEWDALAARAFTTGPWAGSATNLHRRALEDGRGRTDAALAGYLRRGAATVLHISEAAVSETLAVDIAVARAKRHAEQSGLSIEAGARGKAASWHADERAAVAGAALADAPEDNGER